MRVRRAQARLCGRAPALPGAHPYKPIKGEGIRWLQSVLDFGLRTRFANAASPSRSTFARRTKIKTYPCKPIKGEEICRSRFMLDFG